MLLNHTTSPNDFIGSFLIVVFVLIIGILISAWALNLATKLFRVEGSKYKNALKVSVAYLLAYAVLVNILASVFHMAGGLLAYIGSFIIFHKLLNKFYNTNLKKNFFIFIVSSILPAIIGALIIIPVRAFVLEPFFVEGVSMRPTFEDNDYILIEKISKKYQRGDIVVFRYPNNPQEFNIKRVVALPGETIRMEGDSLFIYNNDSPAGTKLEEGYLFLGKKTYVYGETLVKLKEDEYYLLGDNRNISYDSRMLGPIPARLIVGKYWKRTPLIE